MSILGDIFGRKKKDEIRDVRNENRTIMVRFPSMAGDSNRTMTIQELKENYSDYLIIDPRVNEKVDLERLANLEDMEEVVAMPPISGG